MNFAFFDNPLFYIGKHYVSTLGLLAFAGWFALGLIVARVLQSDWVRRLFSRLKLDPNFIAVVTMILSLASVVFSIVSGINAAGVPLAWTAPLPGINLSLLQIFLMIAMLVAVFWLSSHTKRFLFNRFLARSGLNRSLQYAISQIVSKVVLIIGIVIVLTNTGVNLGALAVFAGAIGVGIGVGLQGIASNFISGLVILAERPISIGDRVEVGDAAGQVQRIGARATVVVTNDNISIIVPNSKFIEDPVTNWTYGDPRVRFRIPVGVAYGSDVEKVRGILIAAGKEHPKSLQDPPPNVFFKEFGDSSLNFELVVWSSEMSHRPARYKSDLNFIIERRLREGGIEIPFPQRDLHIRSSDVDFGGAIERNTASGDGAARA
jgi:small-conductance mechanosensitive channel